MSVCLVGRVSFPFLLTDGETEAQKGGVTCPQSVVDLEPPQSCSQLFSSHLGHGEKEGLPTLFPMQEPQLLQGQGEAMSLSAVAGGTMARMVSTSPRRQEKQGT